MKSITRFLSLALILLYTNQLLAQMPVQYDGAALLQKLKKLKVVGKVLYIAAHPDDENTRLITWLANEKNITTAYLSLTHGEGGQNLIGTELGEDLGWIRMHELLQARQIDGGTQFFSRAADFGFSKNYKETLKFWNKDKILEDITYVIRSFQPDIIITRFSPLPSNTHGHHTTSAMLALDASESAADTNFYYNQLDKVQPWSTQRVIWNTSFYFFDLNKAINKDTLMQVDVGTFIPLLGKSCTEIAALSRSCHKSQGFGTQSVRGEAFEYFIPLSGSKASDKNPLSGINFNWNRIKNSSSIQKKIDTLIKKFNPEQPQAVASDLLTLYQLMYNHPEREFIQYKMNEVAELIKQCLGIYIEISTSDYIYAPGDSIRFQVECINRSGELLSYINLTLDQNSKLLSGDFVFNKSVDGNQSIKWISPEYVINDSAFYYAQAYNENHTPYTQTYQSYISGDVFSLMGFSVHPSFNQTVPYLDLTWHGHVVHKKQDPVLGEVYKPVYIAPPITATPSQSLLFFTDNTSQTLDIELQSFKSNVSGYVDLALPKGWSCSPNNQSFSFQSKREIKHIQFIITPPPNSDTSHLQIRIHADGQIFNHAIKEISYAHIPHIVRFPKAECKLVRQDLLSSKTRIGYLPGAGDGLETGLKYLGYQVETITTDNLTVSSLKEYKSVIVGIRAYNIYANSKFINEQLCAYAQEGGTVILQYITTADLKTKEIGPYFLEIGRGRVTDETAMPTYINHSHPLFSYPHHIDSTDWNGWVQERGLYFAEKWDTAHFFPVLSMHDPGEEEAKGALLIAKHGKGLFIYTGLSFFRQIPQGVPGAYKLLLNLIEMNPDMIKP